MKRVYVAGSSREIARVKSVLECVRTSPHLTCSCDWTGEFGEGVTRLPEHEVDARTRRIVTDRDIHGVLSADFILYLAPNLPTTTKMGWFELGFAAACYRFAGKPRILVAGPDRYQSICTEVAHEFFEFDLDAIPWMEAQP